MRAEIYNKKKKKKVVMKMVLAELEQKLQHCDSCPLGTTRKHMVFGKGSLSATIMFIGEGPGADEDAQGIPFVGRAGQLLDKIVAAAELPWDDIYVCNVVKCRPPGWPFPATAPAASAGALRPRAIFSS